MNEERKNVFVIVRETVEVKTQLLQKSREEGYNELSKFIRHMWRQWL